MHFYESAAGVLYDSIAFLCHHYRGGAAGSNAFCATIESREIHMSPHLLPFLWEEEKASLVRKLLFEDWSYSQCNLKKAGQILSNRSYMKNQFIEYYFSQIPGAAYKLRNLAYPDTIEFLQQTKLPSPVLTYVLYTLYNFDNALQELFSILDSVHSEVMILHNRFMEQHPEFIDTRNHTIEKLFAVSGTKNTASSFRFSLSLFEPEEIMFRREEPNHFILGPDYEQALDTAYRYCHVTPLAFVRSLGNEAKCLIFEALIHRSTMSAFEMEKDLHMTRNTVSRNIKEMRESGIVRINHIEGLSYYYTLNRDYIRAASKQIQLLLDR